MEPALKRLLVLCMAVVIGSEVAIRWSGSSDPVADAVMDARVAERHGDYVLGLTLLRQATKAHPERVLGWLELGGRLIPIGTRAAAAEALGAYEHAAACQDDDILEVDARRGYALLLALSGRLPEAIPRLQAAAAAGDTQALRVLALLQQGRGSAADADFAADAPAVAALQTALQSLPDDCALRAAKAVLEAEAGAPAAARTVLAAASPSQPDADGWVRLEEARCAAALGQDGRAAVLLGMVPQVVGSMPLESVVPLARADLAADRLFGRGPATAALLARWPAHAPWVDLPARPVVKAAAAPGVWAGAGQPPGMQEQPPHALGR